MDHNLKHNTKKELSSGVASPLGATVVDGGVNFSIFSHFADEVFLLLFDTANSTPSDIIKVSSRTGNNWHVKVHDISVGQLYGYKIRGKYDPASGQRFNEFKLVLDPYAKALTHKFVNKDNLLLPYIVSGKSQDLVMDCRDNCHIVPKAIVIDDYFDWQGVVSPEIPIDESIIYEVHVKGFTAHHSSGVVSPGTYSGLIEKIPYLKNLGINTVELLPVHEFHDRKMLIDKGLSEYWGYNTIAFFAPEQSYSSLSYPSCQVTEFKTMVREFHRSGIDVILDVVYNHTGEGNELGPILSFKGVDNASYYRLAGTQRDPYRYYNNDAGCGNVIDIEHPEVLSLVLDSLRYWVTEMHVDGFRFDLASILARVKGSYDKSSLFFEKISEDPVLSKVKMIAEPWDLTTFQVGNFPANWSEWNGKFRDNVRKHIKGDAGQLKEFASRMTGSSELYGDDGRSPFHSVNFITCHDGFTLNDLVSFNEKHNEANLENNADGSDDNHSWNCGDEGISDRPEVWQLRKRQIKNFLACLMFASGTPMLLGGDEFQRSQQGNNNCYCQDNELSWFDWSMLEQNQDIYEFLVKLISIRKCYPILRTKRYLTGDDHDHDGVADIIWYNDKLGSVDWDNPECRFMAYQLDGSELEADKNNNYHLLIAFNTDVACVSMQLPQHDGMKWYKIVDTYCEPPLDCLENSSEVLLSDQSIYLVESRALVLLINR